MKRNQGQIFARHLGPGWFRHANGESCWPSQAPCEGSQDWTLKDVASCFLSLESATGHPHPGIWGRILPWALPLLSPSHPFCPQTAICWKDRQTNQAFHSWVGSVKPSHLRRRWKPKLQRRAVVWCRTWLHSPGNGAPEKWAAVTMKITGLGRDRVDLRVSEEGGKRVCNVAKVPHVLPGP